MEFSTETDGREDSIAGLFETTFRDSEGTEEGRLIGALARKLLQESLPGELVTVLALTDGTLAGAIMFTPLRYPEDPRQTVLLAPVAVATDRQGRGIGQALLRQGLKVMRDRGADIAITYGDPDYYGKLGFQQISETFARPPLALNFPHGWQALSLTGAALSPLQGPSHCVRAFDDPAYW